MPPSAPALVSVGYWTPVSLKHRLVGGGGALVWPDMQCGGSTMLGSPRTLVQGIYNNIWWLFFFLEYLQQENLRSAPFLFTAVGRLKLKLFILGKRINTEHKIKHLLSRTCHQKWKDYKHWAHKYEAPRRWNMNHVRLDELGKRKGK